MKILSSTFWFMLGGAVALLITNQGVIAANVGDLTTEAGIAIYNLHDVLLDYVVLFMGGTLFAALTIIVVKVIKKIKK